MCLINIHESVSKIGHIKLGGHRAFLDLWMTFDLCSGRFENKYTLKPRGPIPYPHAKFQLHNTTYIHTDLEILVVEIFSTEKSCSLKTQNARGQVCDREVLVGCVGTFIQRNVFIDFSHWGSPTEF